MLLLIVVASGTGVLAVWAGFNAFFHNVITPLSYFYLALPVLLFVLAITIVIRKFIFGLIGLAVIYFGFIYFVIYQFLECARAGGC